MKRGLLLVLIFCFVSHAAPLQEFVSAARAEHGSPGEKAAPLLVQNMPERDQTNLIAAFLLENPDLAFKARAEFSSAQQIPEELFLNDVLPYAVFELFTIDREVRELSFAPLTNANSTVDGIWSQLPSSKAIQ